MTPKIVGVIFSRADLRRALRMRKPPDLFEVRIDRFIHCLDVLSAAIERLPAPIIITCRHPREGGAHNLSPSRRRALLLKFLSAAAWLDVELRSAVSFRPLLRSARDARVRTIISFHDFRGTPSAARLDKVASTAGSLGADIIKVATRTDSVSQMDRLLDFFERERGRSEVAAMGIGKLGRRSRLLLANRECALNYAHLDFPSAAGQLSISELRRALPSRQALFPQPPVTRRRAPREALGGSL
jgi:3-dehydroquinate dehydratase-1